ncbi:MAG TPA: hypothetical protein VMT91_02910 [Anaerolineales bacterium]|nr:hypothetical protein [Anaerolineales bacterium]
MKALRQTLAVLFSVVCLAACSSVPASPNLPNTPNCAYNWDSQSLPDLTTKVQAAVKAAGLRGVTASAVAFGEDCNDPKTGQTRGFAVMETDFHVTAQVVDLTDKETLGNLAKEILKVLDTFPVGKIPGPQAGYIEITFQSGSDQSNLHFSVRQGEAARKQGLHGAALLDKLLEK